MPKLKLKESPRLYVDKDTVENLKDKLHSPFLTGIAEDVLRDAERLVRAKPLSEDMVEMHGYQSLTRPIDSQLQCLTTAWVLTKKAKYRKAAIRHLENVLNFNQISCEANRTIPASVDMGFCLSYGEWACTVGLMYDIFRSDMTAEEKNVFFAVLDRFLMKAALQCVEKPMWWANKKWSNWNGVCAGGMGVMALAFYDDHPGAKKLVPFVEESLGEYFKSYIENGGGCLEGTGYWNYGMNYAMRYLLSWENATGRKHPALKIKELGYSLNFPLDFTGVTFGDNDGWGPTCFFFKLARRMNQPAAAMNAATYLMRAASWPRQMPQKKHPLRVTGGEILYAADCIPTSKQLERLEKERARKKQPVARVYNPMGWAALADDDAFPTLRMAVRGGSSAITGHGMIDLLSIRCRVNGELMITDQQDGGYLSTTFTGRGHELFGRSSASKSTLLIDGLGCNTNVECKKTETVKGKGILGIRVDGSGVYLPRWKNKFTGRLVLLVDSSYWLVIDRIEQNGPVETHWMESRFFTFAETKRTRNSVSFKSGRERMQLTYASLGDATILEAVGLPPNPTMPAAKMYRCMDKAPVNDSLHVTALNPGAAKLGVTLAKEKGDVYVIEVRKPGSKSRKIRVSSQLRLRQERR